ncbi:thiamine-phosphate kinase [Alteribacillus sp. HJP-4]|uniref:thiamine-phosphate kinase n=1 Tax=Alteribacillus sp. HJP-4 TaxID=2775394 RepID=UPI0035CD0354
MPEDEFEWIRKHMPDRYHQAGLIEGIGDDAALYEPDRNRIEIICVDTMVEGIHFRKDTLSPEDIGHKALAVNISDVAAMGGFPVFYVVSMAIPPQWTDEDLSGIYRGMKHLSDKYEADMIGGDTVSSPHDLVITVTVTGYTEKNTRLLRRNARPGDVVFITGPTGRSAAGLKLLLDKGRHALYTATEKMLISYHQRPQPRVKAGRIAADLKSRISLNDISDGLASEAWEIAEASGVKILLNEAQLPEADELKGFPVGQRLDWMLYGGEDFELIGTIPAADWPRLQNMMAAADQPVFSIGEVTEGPASVILNTKIGKDEKLTKKGYNHFK